jgi:peptidoglycan/LPS O-acetylase OafA/YrhL
MGILRLILSLSVVLDHTGPLFGLHLLSGKIAVQAFFIISGFYMALILNEKYSIADAANKQEMYWLYISNRFLRIFPLYWLTFLLTLLFLLLTGQFFTLFPGHLPLDLFLKNVSLFVTPDYFLYLPKIYSGLYIFQAWTLGLELFFYFVAPWCVYLKKRTLLLLIVLSMGVRLFLTHFFIAYPLAFTDRFFLTEINFFLFGVLAYKVYKSMKGHVHFPFFAKTLFFCLLIFTFFYQFIPLPDVFSSNPIQWLYFLLFSASIPGIFLLTQNSKFDRFIGNFSYPIYIGHALFIDIGKHIFPGLSSNRFFPLIIILISIFWAISVEEFFLAPIERMRQRRVKNKDREATIPVQKNS